MKQSRLMSWLETALSTATGLGLSLLLQWIFLPILLGVPMPLHVNLTFAAIMTVASLGRGFVMRRVFEALHIRRPLSPFMQAVIAERFRQVEQEGWSTGHDDAEHGDGDLANAGACYINYAGAPAGSPPPRQWRWAPHWWKPAGVRRDLVRGVALAIAEGERLDRLKSRKDSK